MRAVNDYSECGSVTQLAVVEKNHGTGKSKLKPLMVESRVQSQSRAATVTHKDVLPLE